IISVTRFGMFVELENTVEGLVHVSYLTDDYYHFDERIYALIGERTGNVYRIGQEVKVKVINVNMDEHVVDFEMITPGVEEKSSKNMLKSKKSVSEKNNIYNYIFRAGVKGPHLRYSQINVCGITEICCHWYN